MFGISARLRFNRPLRDDTSMPVTLAWARRSVSVPGAGGGLPSSILWVSSRRSRYASTHEDRDARRCISASEYSSSRPASSTSRLKTRLVTSASPSALWGLSWERPSAPANFSSEYSHDGLSTYASSSVSAFGAREPDALGGQEPQVEVDVVPHDGQSAHEGLQPARNL